MREKVEVNKEVIKNEIFNLKTLLNTIISINTSNVDLKVKDTQKITWIELILCLITQGRTFKL